MGRFLNVVLLNNLNKIFTQLANIIFKIASKLKGTSYSVSFKIKMGILNFSFMVIYGFDIDMYFCLFRDRNSHAILFPEK